ncbi:MAG: ABC transporter substrate-binding protein [Actinobacteria bacterium]|nr:ABC transporter substrate-binding protein [Actinomycetota bacterium]
MRRDLAAAAIALVLAVLLLVPAAAMAGTSASPGAASVYRIGILEDFDGINPFSAWSGPSWECFRLSYNFLTWYDREYRPAPDLARSWQTSADGKTWTFHIIEGMKWQDGVPLTALDVAFTYNLILDTQDAAYAQYLTGVTSVTAPDAATVVITTRRPSAGMLALYIPILPEHIWKRADPQNLGGFKNWPLVGSGPFRVAELEKGKWMRLAANPDYPRELGGPPTIDEVYFVIDPNADAMIQDYKTGELDAIVNWPATYYKILKSLPGTTAVAAPAIGFHELGFNCWASPKSKGDPLLLDVAVRQAIGWAIDKDRINAASMAGLAVPGTSLISPAQGLWHWEVPAGQTPAYDPEKAKQILDDAGYTDRDGDGVREDARGKKLDFRLVTLNEYPEDQSAGKMIVSWCADIGVKLRLEQKDEGTFGDEVYDNADYDLFIWSWRGDIDPGFMLSTFTTTQILNWGDSQYSNPEYDALYVAQAEALDPAKPDDPTARKMVTDKMQAILYRDTPYVILWYNVNLQAFRSDRWAGYGAVPVKDGAPFFNFTRATYQDLRPRVAGAVAAPDGGLPWIYVLAGAAALATLVIVVGVVRRRPRAVEDA